MPSVLIIDDEPAVASALSRFFERAGHQASSAGTGAAGIALVERDRPDLVLLDLRLPDMTGFDVLARVRALRTLVIMITGYGDVELAVRAMQEGAESFLPKPVDLAQLRAAAERAFEKVRLRRLSAYVADRRGRVGAAALLGSSPPMRELAEQIEALARSDRATVLVTGESGTGKGRVAELIHRLSRRADQPFIEVNCAARAAARAAGRDGSSPDAELFGQELAAPPGGDVASDTHRVGLLDVADGGTLFIDEVTALEPHLQPGLLRVLEGKSFRRAGGVRDVPVDVRVVAATTRDLVGEVTEGRFREDLYYRLGVMPVSLPPLRVRTREDLLGLAAHLLEELRPDLPDSPAALDDAAQERLLRYSWPGNLRELRNVLERAMIIARGAALIGAEHLPAELRDATGAGLGQHVPRTLAEVERLHVDRTLRAHNANRTRAARELGISRATLIKKIKEYGLADAR